MTTIAAGRARASAGASDWGSHLATRVVAEVAELAGGRLRPEVARLLTDVTVEGYAVFLDVLSGDAQASSPEHLAGLVGNLFDDVDISLEDAMALHRHLEQVLWREVRDLAPPELASAPPAELEAATHRFFNDLAVALADQYLAARRNHDSDRDAAETEVLACLLSSPPQLGQARRVARRLGVDFDVPWDVAVYASADDGVPLGSDVAGRVRRALWGAVVLVGRLDPGLVVAVHRRGTTAEPPDLGPDVVSGWGGTHTDVRGLREGYEEALEVLELARRQGLRELHLEDAWFDRFLIGSVSAEELSERVLAPLTDLTANRRAAVLQTLEAYLDCGGSVTSVADALHLHRQSINYRMQNVRRLFGPLLLTPNGRLALHIAVKAARLRRS
jgi:PucR C-terminal helix-turn-helix domain/GGDEF-like domain